ncbi:MAG: ATP12 family protein, partial [Hyphomonas sp.]
MTTDPRPKRFYTTAAAEPLGHTWTTALDGRTLKTPQRNPFALPARGLAEAIAAEWQAQGEHVELLQLHLTRLANDAIDRTP